MENRKTMYLFEITVEKIVIDPQSLLESFSFDPGLINQLPVVVKVKFSDCLQVDIDAEASLNFDMEGTNVISGKSCIFPLSSKQMESEMQKSPMYIEVFNLTEGDMAPILLGKTKINLSPLFLATVSRGNFLGNSPASNRVKIDENLSDIFGRDCGKLKVSLHFSSLGHAFLNDFKSMSSQNDLNKIVHVGDLKNNFNFLQDSRICKV